MDGREVNGRKGKDGMKMTILAVVAAIAVTLVVLFLYLSNSWDDMAMTVFVGLLWGAVIYVASTFEGDGE